MSETMTTESSQKVDDAVMMTLRAVAAGDLRSLAYLHSTELTKEMLEELRSVPFNQRVGLSLHSMAAADAFDLIDRGLQDLPPDRSISLLDTLAVDYADIYITHQLRADPTESVWLDEDKLIHQGPMFEIREWYEHYGVKAANWRKCPDDHLVLQLEFIAVLLEQNDVTLEQVARFMDDHLLRWIGLFADQVAGYCATEFYKGLAKLTVIYLDELRDHLANLAQCERRTHTQATAIDSGNMALHDQQPYVPGIGPVV